MNGRRLLGQTLGEIAGDALDAGREAATIVRVTMLELDLPLDIRVAIDADGPVLVGDVPLFRLRTAFDPPPAQLRVRWGAVPVEAAA
jgi:hypothetical protein